MRPALKGLDVERRAQTHVSWVLLTATEAWKIKRPVELGFLDFSTLAQRKIACEAEVALNRRLAPDVYLDVVPLGAGPCGQLVPWQTPAVEWAVRMRRLPDDQQAGQLLARSALTLETIDRIADRIAEFHRHCSPAPASFAEPELIAHNTIENFAQADDCPGRLLGLRSALEIEAWQLTWMRQSVDVLRRRASAGFVRDGHGDLRLEHVYVDPEAIRIIDCIEFNERFRFADVAADIAFLSMDLARSDAPRLAERLLSRYAQRTGDYGLYRVIDFYESYRAFIRGKIACLALDVAGADAARTEARRQEARNYFLFAQACGRPSLVPPQIIAVGGLIGAGKSTVADAVSAALGGPVVEADRTRKQLLGIDPQDSAVAVGGAYDAQTTERVYDEIMTRAGWVLDSGRPVVLDATFRSASLRDKADALAMAKGVPITFVECQAPEAVLRQRLRDRRPGSTASDATADLLSTFMTEYEAPADAVRLNTVGTPDQVRARAVALVT